MSTRLDVLIVRPNNKAAIYPGLEERNLTGCEPPFWAALLAGFLRSKNYSVVLLDAEAEGQTYNETADLINHLKPLLTVIAVSGTNPHASTMNMIGVQNLAPKLFGTVVMLHGLHPSAAVQDCFLPGVDYVVEHEGFETIPQTIELLKHERTKEDPLIPGLWAKAASYAPATKLANLADLPMPAWDLLPMDKYRAHIELCMGGHPRQPYGLVYTSLGCPFKCTFCNINAMFPEHTIRYRPEDHVVAEIKFLNEKYGIKNIKIIDEMLALEEKRTVSLFTKIAALHLGLNMRVYGRVDTVTVPMLDALAAAGVSWIGYGFETGNAQVLTQSRKGNAKLIDKSFQIIEQSHSAGLHVSACYLFGLPGDTDETHRQTFDLMLRHNCEWANIFTVMPYPGSALYDEAVASGWQPPNNYTGWSQYTPNSHPLREEWATRWRDWAFNSYNSNPGYLASIQAKFDLPTRHVIEDMTKFKLRRDYDAK